MDSNYLKRDLGGSGVAGGERKLDRGVGGDPVVPMSFLLYSNHTVEYEGFVDPILWGVT